MFGYEPLAMNVMHILKCRNGIPGVDVLILSFRSLLCRVHNTPKSLPGMTTASKVKDLSISKARYESSKTQPSDQLCCVLELERMQPDV